MTEELAQIDALELQKMLDDAELTVVVKRHYAETEAYQSMLRSRYETNHRFYAPPTGDQWPEDAAARPGAIHITHNIVRPGVDTEARVESKLPRLTLVAEKSDEETRKRVEAAEKLMIRFLQLSGWKVWLNALNKCRGIYGKGILKPIWNAEDKRPDVVVVENPSNVRFGWGTSDYTVIDWALCEYKLSIVEAKRRYKQIEVVESTRDRGQPLTILVHSDHADWLDQSGVGRPSTGFTAGDSLNHRQVSDYDDRQLDFWDYWWKDATGNVHNAVFLNAVLVFQKPHPEYPEVPYIPIEFDHEPGSPEGLSLVSDLIDVQYEMNRALSHFAQVVNDNIDPAWQLEGETADAVPPGTVPKAGEITAAGQGNKITAIEKPVNQFPVQQLIAELYKAFHFGTGLPEIMFSMPPSAQTAGRALAVTIEASANRLDPRRDILYDGLWKLLIFWTFMVEKMNPKILVPSENGDEFEEAGVGDLVKGFRRWEFVAPEITPRDVVEHTNNTVNKVQAKLISLEDAMDELGVDSPMEMIEKIKTERTDPKLFPGDAQAFLANFGLMLQLLPQLQQMGVELPGFPTPNGAGQQALEAQTAQPTLSEEDNQSAPGAPAGLAGSPAPGGGPNLQNQSLVRSTPTGGAQSLQQIRTTVGG